MARWTIIIAVLSLGLNIGLATAVGLSLWQQSTRSRLNEFAALIKPEDDNQNPHGPRRDPPNMQALENAIRSCGNALNSYTEIAENCPRLTPIIAALPRTDQGQPQIPKTRDGDIDIAKILEYTPANMRGPRRPPRPRNFQELQDDLGLAPEQARAFRRILQGQAQNRRQLNQQLIDSKRELEILMLQEDFDVEQALALYVKTLETREQALGAHAQAFLAFYRGLNSEQREIMRHWANGNILALLE